MCARFTSLKLSFFIALSLLPRLLCAADSTSSTDWVLAAQKFSFSRTSNVAGAENITTLLPQLILEQIATGSTRVLPTNEVLDRKLNTLQTERLSLFLQLSKEYKTRDALVLTNISPRKLEKQLAAEQKKIAEIEKQIADNLSQVDEEMRLAAPAIERETALSRGEAVTAAHDSASEGEGLRFPFPLQLPLPFFRGEEQDTRTSEGISLYKNDITALFTPSEKALEGGSESHVFESEVVSAKINGLISGSMTVFGDYVSVSVALTVYPGCKSGGVVTEIGEISDLIPLAERIARALTPKLSNAMPVLLHLQVFPEEIAKTASLSIDSIVSTEIPPELAIDAAIHTISVSAPGYETASTTYLFEGRNQYDIRISLVPEVKGSLSLGLKKLKDGMFYANGVDAAGVSAEEPRASITVNGKSVLGVFTVGSGESENTAFFYIPARLAQENASLLVNAKPYDRAANIDKRRRSMYTAYTALICSLPFTFYCVGNFTAVNNGYALGRTSYDDALKWQNRMNVSLGITAAAGTWTLIELFRYLHAANSVLPAQAYTDTK